MSVGVFLSLRESFTDPADGAELHEAVNAVLREQGVEEIADPEDPPHVCDRGRIDIDHTSGQTLSELGAYAKHGDYVFLNLWFLNINPYRVVFVPRTLEPDETAFQQTFLGRTVNIHVGSSYGLYSELVAVAGELMIPVAEERVLSNQEVAEILSGKQLEVATYFDETPNRQLHHLQMAWLLMYEACLMSMRDDVPMVTAG